MHSFTIIAIDAIMWNEVHIINYLLDQIQRHQYYEISSLFYILLI